MAAVCSCAAAGGIKNDSPDGLSFACRHAIASLSLYLCMLIINSPFGLFTGMRCIPLHLSETKIRQLT